MMMIGGHGGTGILIASFSDIVSASQYFVKFLDLSL